jgi:hypothetical protein
MAKKEQKKQSKSRKQSGGSHHMHQNSEVPSTSSNSVIYVILGILLASVIGIVAYLILKTEKNNAVTMPVVSQPVASAPKNNKGSKDKMTDLSLAHPELSGYRDVVIDADNPSQISYWDYLNMKDHERIINPLLPPERSYENTYGIPINIPSRGFSGGFQQVGTLYKNQITNDEKVIGNSPDTVIIPLFGRPLYPGSNKWNYYVTSDKYAMVKMPFTFKGKKTDDQYGIDELFEGDVITLPEYNGEFVVKIYQYDKPRYIPFIY